MKARLVPDGTLRPAHSPLLKLDLGLPPGLAFEGGVSEHVLVDHSFVQRDVHRVPEGRQRSHDPGAASPRRRLPSLNR